MWSCKHCHQIYLCPVLIGVCVWSSHNVLPRNFYFQSPFTHELAPHSMRWLLNATSHASEFRHESPSNASLSLTEVELKHKKIVFFKSVIMCLCVLWLFSILRDSNSDFVGVSTRIRGNKSLSIIHKIIKKFFFVSRKWKEKEKKKIRRWRWSIMMWFDKRGFEIKIT